MTSSIFPYENPKVALELSKQIERMGWQPFGHAVRASSRRLERGSSFQSSRKRLICESPRVADRFAVVAAQTAVAFVRVSQPASCRVLRSVYERVDPSHAVGLLGDFVLGKANFGSAFMRERNQAPSILLKLVLANRLVGPVTYILSVLRVRRRFETSAY